MSFSQITNLGAGYWSNPSVWSTNSIPTVNDSVYLSYDIIIDVNASCRSLNTNGHNVTVNPGVSFNVFGSVQDFDGNNYNAITICSQVWLKENLRVSHYRNGDAIPQVTDTVEWANLTTGAWCYYNNDSANNSIYGKLYNWYAVNDPRGLTPIGWHVPSNIEWEEISSCLGGGFLCGGEMKETGTAFWQSPNLGATNSSGFTGLPGGFRYQSGFSSRNLYNFLWSSTAETTTKAWYRNLGYGTTGLGNASDSKANGCSVRAVRD